MQPNPRFTAAERVVWLVSVASAAAFVVFAAKHATRVPFFDEFSSFRFLFGAEGTSLAAYWEQHNEHRIPLPRLLYVAAVRLGGLDFRMPIFLNALLLIAATTLLVRAVRRARGHTAACDAFLPLVVLSVGQHENLTWGFQIQFILSVAMFFGVLALVAQPAFAESTWRVALAGLLSLLQPLCGANGVAFCPALGALFVVLGVRAARSGHTRAGLLGIFIGLAVWALVPAYFHGLKPTDYHPPAKSLSVVLVSFVNLIGLGLGPATHLVHPPGFAGVTVVGVAMAVLVAVTGGMLIRAACDPERRSQALALGALLGATLCLAAGLAYGRAGVGSVLSANRYVTLVVPIPVVVYFAWVVCGRGGLSRVAPALLCAAAVAGAYPNTAFGWQQARYHTIHLRPLSFDINAGIPLSFLADKYRYVFPNSPEARSLGFALLAKEGVKPFDRIVPDPPMASVRVPLRASPTEFHTPGDHGHVVFALPQKQQVFGFRVVYEAHYENRNLPGNILSWDPSGAFPPGPGFAVLNQLGHTDGPISSYVFVNGEADHLRIDVYGRGSWLKVHELHVLTRAESVE